MQYIFHSEAGDSHVNEDALAAVRHPHDENALICVLADGQGGQFGGAEAAQLALETGLQLALQRQSDDLLLNATWREILRRVDEVVEAENPCRIYHVHRFMRDADASLWSFVRR